MTRIGAEPKPPWRLVPRAVRRGVEDLLGCHVARATRVWGGYAPSPTFRLFLADGRRVFFKGIGPTSNPVMHPALEAEERVYRELEPWIAPWSPAFFGSFHLADWHVLLLEDLGRPGVPPWTPAALANVMAGCAAFHRHSLGQDLPNWLARDRHAALARRWTDLAAEDGGLAALAELAGEHASVARAWTDAALERLRLAAEQLADASPPHSLLHFDTRSDNLRLLSGGRLKLFDWPYACVGPPEVDIVAFAQSIAGEDGPPPEEVVAVYARHLPVREDVMAAAIAAVAGYFGSLAWRAEIPGLPRVRSIQRRQLKTSLAWAARRLQLPPATWLAAISD